MSLVAEGLNVGGVSGLPEKLSSSQEEFYRMDLLGI
jgi:hypothetical protein